MDIKPNKALYLSLLIAAVIIVLISFFIPADCPCFTIVAGIGCGVLTSVVVAWLIDDANCKKQVEDIKQKQKLIFCDYKFSIERLRFRIANTAKMKSKDYGEHTLREWLNILLDIKLYSSDNDPERSRACTYQMIANQLDMLLPTLEILKRQYPLLVEANIVNDSKFNDCIDAQISACKEASSFYESPESRLNCEHVNDAVCLLVEEYTKYFKLGNINEPFSKP